MSDTFHDLDFLAPSMADDPDSLTAPPSMTNSLYEDARSGYSTPAWWGAVEAHDAVEGHSAVEGHEAVEGRDNDNESKSRDQDRRTNTHSGRATAGQLLDDVADSANETDDAERCGSMTAPVD